MPLDDLLALIRTMQRVADLHGAALRESQPLTRYALVDPLLRRLGWDTEDPALVVPEYRSGSGAHEYGLLDGGRLVALVEAHALDEPLRESVEALLVAAREAGAAYGAITDGWRWELYAASREASGSIAAFDLAGDAEAVCVSALALWRPLLLSRMAEEAGLSEPDPPQWDAEAGQEAGWRSLATFFPALNDARPRAIQFPDATQLSIGTWIALPMEVTRWLWEHGHYTETLPPIALRRRYVIASSPYHPTGARFSQPKRVGPLWLEGQINAPYCASNARLIVEHAGLDPAQFRVRLRD